MEQINSNLNLTRKWRPKNFDQLIGQKIPIRMLKNGLFLNKLFPVYLFSGQRGCGKTTTARVFGSALNCKNLNNFRLNPENTKIPCLQCDSCKSMMQTNHPDFIEIDAASHTGVENVRKILENCSYMPTFSDKKIYLIDEAHMLSKAAFNAFLKILEEPPKSTLFILATTEIQKFPQTVLSRCFQVIFRPVNNHDIKNHLQQICKYENIEIEDQAFDLLTKETEGSVRDAINLLEQVRFSQTKITSDAVLKILGKVSEKEFFCLFETLLDQDSQKFLNIFNSDSFENVNPQTLWSMIIQLCRTLIWIKFKVKNLPTYFYNTQILHNLAKKCSINRLNSLLQLLWSQEEIFLKTQQKLIFLETVLLQICQQVNISDLKDIVKLCSTNNVEEKKEEKKDCAPSIKNTNWTSFLNDLKSTNDQLLISILNQVQYEGKDEEKKIINVIVANNSQFFKDKIKESKDGWMPIFLKYFPNYIGFNFISSNNQNSNQKLHQFKKMPSKSFDIQNSFKKTNFSNTFIDISDTTKWPKANLIIKHFPGKIKK